ncbi:MAG: hypothetical protein NZ518_00540 [Dehalococcoidia bacterium]|nr:hypothetical protein [Dehalococcoidia bacterium]
MNQTQRFVVSLPERALRATAAVVGGAVHETATVVLPPVVRQSKLYQTTVARLLRVVIELIGGVPGQFADEPLPVSELMARKTVGNAVEVAGLFAVGLSPLWVLAAVADVAGGTKTYLHALVDELKTVGVLSPHADIPSVDALLTTLADASGTLADTLDVPPLSADDLRATVARLQANADALPTPDDLATAFARLQQAARHEGRPLREIAGMVALGAARAGLSVGNERLVRYYQRAAQTIASEGLLAYLGRVSQPYRSRALSHFDPDRVSFTERLLRPRRPPVETIDIAPAAPKPPAARALPDPTD